jgi:hypothetical protein
MNHQQPAGVSRRLIVKGGVYALTGIAIASLTRTAISAVETKLAKSAVQYVDAGKEEGKNCEDCTQFIPGKTPQSSGACKIVEGEINPHGHCIAFTPKPKKKSLATECRSVGDGTDLKNSSVTTSSSGKQVKR